MKTILLILALCFSVSAFSTELPTIKKSNKAATIEATYPGGAKAYNSFVGLVINKIVYTGISQKLPAGSYIVTLQFHVNASGNISKIQAVSAYGFGLEDAAIAEFSKTCRWTPARSAGQKVKNIQTQSFRFDVF
jgi:hypothetical protein